jgi:uncharacterized membrane protein
MKSTCVTPTQPIVVKEVDDDVEMPEMMDADEIVSDSYLLPWAR